ncbi:MAG: glutathione synthase, partial [Pseudomonadota bacterium]
MDPISHIKPQKDSTLAIMLGAQALGAELYYMEQDDLYIEDNGVFATVQPVKVFDDNHKWCELSDKSNMDLSALDYILMRKDPPVDKRFIHTCHILEHAARNGIKVINNPTALHQFNEKMFATHFSEFCPPYQISSDLSPLRKFLEKHEKIIIKPVDSMGGEGVFMVHKNDVNFEVIWEMQTNNGRYPIIAQAFIPAIDKGDKRIIIIDGIP